MEPVSIKAKIYVSKMMTMMMMTIIKPLNVILSRNEGSETPKIEISKS